MTPSAGPGPGLGRIARVLTGIAACALVTMMLWTIADVGLRSTARIAIDGTVAAVETLLVLVAFFALADAIGRDELIRVDVFDTALGARRVRVLQALGEAATVVFLGLLVVTVLTPLMDAWQFGDVKPDLPVPIWTLLLAIEVAWWPPSSPRPPGCCARSPPFCAAPPGLSTPPGPRPPCSRPTSPE